MTTPRPTAAEKSLPPTAINALVTEQGVNMGDHGQDVTRAVAIEPSETVESLLARTLYRRDWRGELSIQEDSYLTIRLAPLPAEATAPAYETVDHETGEVV